MAGGEIYQMVPHTFSSDLCVKYMNPESRECLSLQEGTSGCAISFSWHL
jgi:hypothetical protein